MPKKKKKEEEEEGEERKHERDTQPQTSQQEVGV
jgi:hypothetical protein